MRTGLSFLLLFLLGGCGGPPAPATYPVKGKVVFPKGPSLEGGMVCLRDATRECIVNGLIKDDGTFTLETIKIPHRKAGAEVGTYDVEVVSPQTKDQQTIPLIVKTKKVTIEAKDNDLTIEVGFPGR